LFPEDAADRSSRALDTLPKIGARAVDQAAVASGLNPRTRAGPYQVVRPLGAGGMAEVWLAQRADGAFKREVALKLPMLLRLPSGGAHAGVDVSHVAGGEHLRLNDRRYPGARSSGRVSHFSRSSALSY
jgi:hypothetical protein